MTWSQICVNPLLNHSFVWGCLNRAIRISPPHPDFGPRKKSRKLCGSSEARRQRQRQWLAPEMPTPKCRRNSQDEKWRFPEIKLPLFFIYLSGIFHYKPSSYCGYPIYGNLQININKQPDDRFDRSWWWRNLTKWMNCAGSSRPRNYRQGEGTHRF